VRIALDYDLTYSLDPTFWRMFIGNAAARRHEVRIVTIRDERHDRTEPLIALEQQLPVIYTRGVAKRFWCAHHAQWTPDIWIDDRPETILYNSETTPEDLAVWRAERGEALA
jgi:hypothetical protein